MYYKLTDQKMQTYNSFQWEVGKWYSIDKDVRGKGGLCTNGWFHCYKDPLVAVLLNPTHAYIKEPMLFRCYVKGRRKLESDKVGFTHMKLGEELKLPVVSTTQRVAFAILCTKIVFKGKRWNTWADGWLSGEDRSVGRVRDMAAAHAAYAIRDAAMIIRDAAYAVRDSARVAGVIGAVGARGAINAVRASVHVAAVSGADINLTAIAKEAMKY